MFLYPYLAKASLGLGLVFALIHPALSQITPNGAGTVVNPQGNQINITGGTQAGANLFHSFRDFNVNSAQIANFLSNPQIQNILARVNGGNPSFINGLLQVTGGNSNLFLMNPAGIVFGQGASLNIPASFTATTANQIGFGNNLFNAFGDNNFSALIGNPDSFVFNTNQAGSIVNAGNLSVTPGQGINLLGGNVVNTGNINAGNITLAAVPGTNRVRISQPGHILSLEIVPPVDSVITPLDLPRLLTGSDLPGISSNGATVQVAGVAIPTGQGVNVTSGNLGTFSQAGTINVLGDRVALLNANLNASGSNGGGTIRVGGEYRGGGVNPFNSRITYVDANSFLNADAVNSGDGGRVIVWGDDTTRFYGNISARGGASSGNGGFAEVSGAQNLTFAGNADLSAPQGSLGTLLLDPVNIFINNGADALGGCALPTILSGCNAGGNITISQATLQALGAATTIVLEASNNITLGTLTGNALTFPSAPGGAITFRADRDGNGVGNFLMNAGDRIVAPGRNINISAASIRAGDIDASTISSQNGGSIILGASRGDISAGSISSGSGVPSGNSGAGGGINILAPLGNVNIAGNVDSRSVVDGTGNSSRAGDITIIGRNVNVGTPSDPSTGVVAAYSRVDTGTSGNGGNITVRATNGGITAGGMGTTAGTSISGTAGTAGNITIDATNDITLFGAIIPQIDPARVFALDSRAILITGGNAGNGGNIRINQNLVSNGNFLVTGDINSSSGVTNPFLNAIGNSARGGDIFITARNVNANSLIASSVANTGSTSNGGNIAVNAQNNLTVDGINSSSLTYRGSPGNGGNITINAQNNLIVFFDISSSSLTSTGSSRNGGNITVNAQNNLTVDRIDSFSSAGSGNSGNGGNIAVNARNNLTVQGISFFSASGGGNSGNGGNTTLNAQNDLYVASILSSSSSRGGNSGNGGNTTFNAQNNLTVIDINSSSYTSPSGGGNSGNGGNITLSSQGKLGVINIDSSSYTSSSGGGNSGNGGNITLSSQGNLFATGDINPRSSSPNGTAGNSGNITLSSQGNITASTISTLSSGITGSGSGGDIAINTGGTLRLSGSLSSASSLGNGGAININSVDSLVFPSSISSNSISGSGNGGSINIVSSQGTLTANSGINSSSSSTTGNARNGGNITLSSQGDLTVTSDINSRSSSTTGTAGNSGNITLSSQGNITASTISTLSSGITGSGSGGDIAINNGGTLQLSGSLSSASSLGNGGAININSIGNIISTSAISSNNISGSGQGGAINIISYQGALSASDINSSSSSTASTAENGGNITLLSQGPLSTGNISSGSSSTAGNGGNITLLSRSSITTSNISSRSTGSGGSGGSISINSGGGGGTLQLSGPLSSQGPSTGTISSESIGSGGSGGSITITTPHNLFLATGSFRARDGSTNATISSQGGANGGAITIIHGGSIEIPFIVGCSGFIPQCRATTINGTRYANGTEFAITSGSGDNTIGNNSLLVVPVPPAINFYGTNIQIITSAPPITPPEQFNIPVEPRTPDPVVVGTPPISLVDPILVAPTINLPVNPPSTEQITIAPPIINNPVVPPPLTNSPVVVPPPTNLQLSRPILDANSPGVQSSVSLTTANSSIPIIDRIPVINLNDRIRLLDDPFKEEFQAYTGLADEIATLDVNQAQDILKRIQNETNSKSVLIYVFFTPENEAEQNARNTSTTRAQLNRIPSNTDILQVVLVPPTGDLIRVKHPNLRRSEVIATVRGFTSSVALLSSDYVNNSKKIYNWIVAPLEDELKKQKIDNLVFLMDSGLRSMPIAALKNSKDKFIIEDYSVGLMPSLSLTDTSYVSMRGSQVFGMGADRFTTPGQGNLPAVPIELNTINQITGGSTFLNENFTLSNLRQARRPQQRIVHLATHGFFTSGVKANSFIQLWGNERLTLDQIRQAGWGTPPVDLLVLSACETASGDREAELGFAGLAIQTGVRSVLASLWEVSDPGTLGLMAAFYQQLQTTTTKAEALRQAQLAILRGEVRLEAGNLVTPQRNYPLSGELQSLRDKPLTHPFYWSAFALVGNPW